MNEVIQMDEKQIKMAIDEIKMALECLKETSHLDNNRKKGFEIAIECMEKQEKQIVKTPHITEQDFPKMNIVRCWNCCEEIKTVKWKYCPYCGQAIKWSD